MCSRNAARSAAVASFIAITALAGGRVQAQTVSGRVIDAVTQDGIAFARVTLLNAQGTAVMATATDSLGNFLVYTQVAGLHRIRTEQLGYATRDSEPLGLRKEESVALLVRMAPQGILLPPIEVTHRGGFERGRDGFKRRLALGRGVFFNRDSILARSPIAVSDAFHGIPKIAVFDVGGHPANIYSMTGGKCLHFFLDNSLTPFHTRRARRRMPPRSRAATRARRTENRSQQGHAISTSIRSCPSTGSRRSKSIATRPRSLGNCRPPVTSRISGAANRRTIAAWFGSGPVTAGSGQPFRRRRRLIL